MKSAPAGDEVPRPEVPDPHLLEQAGIVLDPHGSRQRCMTWTVERRVVRSRSTIFVLEVSYKGTRQRLYYKTEHVPPAGDASRVARELEQRRRALEVERALTGTLSQAFREEAVAFDAPVLVDPQGLTAIRVAVEGRGLGKVVWNGVRARTLRPLLWPYFVVGRALNIVEAVGRGVDTGLTAEQVLRRLETNLAKSDSHLERGQRLAVERAVDRLLLAAKDATRTLWTHGDLSQTNVLVTKNRVGIIDFSWKPQLPCEDLARFIARIESESPRLGPWAARATESALRGYGIAPDAPPPEWRLAYLQRALQALRKPSRSASRWGHTALARSLRSISD